MFIRRRVPEQGPLKADVIGVGAFGRHHCAKYRAIPGVELFAVADTSPEIRHTAAAQYGVLAVADWRELLGKVDLVSICSPAVTHAAIVRAFLNAGAHVLVEKPIATTMAEADELVALARKTGLTLTVGHQERFVFARTGLLDQDVQPLEIQCWRRGPWTGRGDELQFRGHGVPGALRIHFVRVPPARTGIRAGIASTRSALTPVSAHGSPAMIMRAGWATSKVAPRNDPSYGRVDMAFVHHTETGNDYSPEESPSIVLAIARYHRDTNGWSDIGYNFLVDQYGTIFEGRAGGIDKAVIGAQAQGYNSFSTGISCIGSFMTAALPDAAMKSVARLIAWKLQLHGAPVGGSLVVTSGGGSLNAHPYGERVTMHRIAGHRDGDSTDCPGNKLYKQLPALRTLAESYAGEAPSTPAGKAKLSLVSDRTVAAYGTAAAVHGTLTDAAGKPVSGKRIAVEKQGASKRWARLTVVRSGSDGSWSAAVTWKATGRLRARATVAGHSVVSPLVTITAATSLVPGRLPSKVLSNAPVVVTGTVRPATAVKIVLEKQLASGRWAAAGTRTVTPTSRGAFRSTFRFAGPARYRISLAAAGATRTAPATVRVTGVASKSGGASAAL